MFFFCSGCIYDSEIFLIISTIIVYSNHKITYVDMSAGVLRLVSNRNLTIHKLLLLHITTFLSSFLFFAYEMPGASCISQKLLPLLDLFYFYIPVFRTFPSFAVL